jgi:signal recognition particle GTPase
LAEANADTIRKLGMGGLALIQKAKSYLENAETNKAAEEIAALRVTMDDMKNLLDRQKNQIAELQDDLESRSAKRGRPRKEAA